VKERPREIPIFYGRKTLVNIPFYESLFEPNFPKIHLNTKLLFRMTIQEEPQHEGGIMRNVVESIAVRYSDLALNSSRNAFERIRRNPQRKHSGHCALTNYSGKQSVLALLMKENAVVTSSVRCILRYREPSDLSRSARRKDVEKNTA